MIRTLLCIALLWLPVGVAAKSFGGLGDLSEVTDKVTDSASASLSGLLQSQLGVSEDQAAGGIGSILSLASEQLSGDDFGKIADAIPGAEDYMSAAKELGAVSGLLENLDGLKAAFDRLGLSSEMVSKFVPVMGDFVGKVGGEEAKKMFLGALDFF